MANQKDEKKESKIITSHRSRVKKANNYVAKQQCEKISIFDREAIVEFYLLEDIVSLYEYRLAKEKNKNVTTRAGQMSKERSITKYEAILEIFRTAVEMAWDQIDSGNYKAVWKAIPEHQLMVAVSNTKNLPVLRALAVDLLNDLSATTFAAVDEVESLNEDLDALESHEANVKSLKGRPSQSEIDAIINAVTVAIPDEPKAKGKPDGQNLA